MICPICKKEIPDNTLKCPYCKARTGLICKNCNTVNSIFDHKCKNCGTEILKICPNCKSVNFPNAEKCRKCGYVLAKPQSIQPLEYPANLISQQSAKNILVRGIKSKDKKIFSLSGEKGCGKSVVLKSVMQDLKNYSWRNRRRPSDRWPAGQDRACTRGYRDERPDLGQTSHPRPSSGRGRA